MRRLAAMFVMTLAIAGWAFGQTKKIPNATPAPAPAKAPSQVAPPADDVGASLKYIERRWVAALIARDAKALTDILDDSYMDTDESGVQSDKKGVLALVTSGDLQLTGIRLTGMLVHAFGTAAVVTGKAEQTGTFKNQEVPRVVTFTDTFAFINGAWRVVASHRSAPRQ